ncbi:patatin-like phospholipase family protein [Nocardioides sp.]|uniref:patatin-like phospholipase family protein n=1 Tax=Nocardioides sp. TaxID=35761 RepID=UPI00378398C3
MTGRGLVLAGGGIRVAWQTGALAALDEDGLSFDHGDGTSGGIFTLGMLLSGQRPDEMVRRWLDLDVRRFVSPLPLRAYLRSPTDWVAFGSADGVRRAVLPALGIDLDRVRLAGPMTGSFNVADFTRKRCVAVPHTEIDEDRLVAGVSLAGVMPAVEVDGRSWTDAVWIQDANLMEAVRRGCDELWVLWCIGNTSRWGTGALEQYVHMIEMSATGALTAELEAIADLNRRRAAGEQVLGSTEPVTVHVVRPDLPIPLDPDLVAGRIDTETLVAMGYRDARRHLATRSPAGTALTETATQTPARELGARITLRATGTTPTGPLGYTLVVEADDLAALRRDPGTALGVVGTLRHPDHGLRLLGGGTGRLAGVGPRRRLEVRAEVRLPGGVGELAVDVPLPPGRPDAARHQTWRLTRPDGTDSSGTAGLTVGQAVRALASFEPSGAHHLTDRARALGLAVGVARGRRARPAPVPA